MMRIFTTRSIIGLFFFILVSNVVLGQVQTKEEEIVRYLGYEETFFRYTTIPYDVSMNVNEFGNFVDIGFLHFMFLPLFFTFLYIKKKGYRILGACLFLYYLISCFHFSKILVSSQGLVLTDISNVNFNDTSQLTILQEVLIGIYKFFLPLFDGLYNTINRTLNIDILTYPVIIGVFLLLIYLVSRIKKRSIRSFAIIYLCFAILFTLLSAAIPWYGYLMLPMGYITAIYFIEHHQKSIYNNFVKMAFYSFSGLFIIASIVLRISNIQPGSDNGQNIFLPAVFAYSAGLIDKDNSLNSVWPGAPQAIHQMNQNDGLVYMVGTTLNYELKNNHSRVRDDNQLGIFDGLVSRFGRENVFLILKEYGFKYFVVDLHTASIDKTPDKTLTKKFNTLMETIYNNPNLELINTDRIIKSGTNVVPGLFGDVQSTGSYAIFGLK